MTQNQLEQAVAKATGDSLSTIRRLGFSIAEPGTDYVDFNAVDRSPLTIDWDHFEYEHDSKDVQTFDILTGIA